MSDQFPSTPWFPRRQPWDWLPNTQPNQFVPPLSIDPGAPLNWRQRITQSPARFLLGCVG